MPEKPWAAALNRLLSERRGLTKGHLAKLAPLDEDGRPFRAAMVSKIAAGQSDNFLLAYLQRLADGFTRFDRDRTVNRNANPDAPAVDLWEFFVSDEQAAMLREREERARGESEEQAFLKRASELFAESLKQARAERETPPAPPTVVEQPRARASKKR